MALSPKEVRDIISNSPFVKEMSDLTCTISYPYLNTQFELKGLYNIYKYFYEQFVRWGNLKKTTSPHIFDQSHQYYRSVLMALQQFIKQELNNVNISPRTLLTLFSRSVLSTIRRVFWCFLSLIIKKIFHSEIDGWLFSYRSEMTIKTLRQEVNFWIEIKFRPVTLHYL